MEKSFKPSILMIKHNEIVNISDTPNMSLLFFIIKSFIVDQFINQISNNQSLINNQNKIIAKFIRQAVNNSDT